MLVWYDSIMKSLKKGINFIQLKFIKCEYPLLLTNYYYIRNGFNILLTTRSRHALQKIAQHRHSPNQGH